MPMLALHPTNPQGLYFGALGASGYVAASNAPAENLAFARFLQSAGSNVWACDNAVANVQINAAIAVLP